MRIITRKRLNEFAEKHPFPELPDTFGSADQVGNLTEKEYTEAVRLLDNLIDTVGEDENHPLASLMEILGFLIEKYEDEHIPEITKI